jgi:hypothetical protein
MLGDDFKTGAFSAKGFRNLYENDKSNLNPFFNLHGGIQFEVETNPVKYFSEE